MTQIARLLLASAMVVVWAIPLGAQQDGFVDPFDIILDAFDTSEGSTFTARFLNRPTAGSASISDPVDDFEHSTGEEPGFTPAHVDIVSTWALELQPGPIDLFGPTDANGLWAPIGRMEVDPPNYEPFHTFTGDQAHDGSQYEEGVLLFGFTLVGTPPVDTAGRCEYVVWVNDLERGATFVNDPNFPGDPATGTNIAFGLGINPGNGPGIQSGFAIVLQESGGFAPAFETDVRGFVTPRYVGVTVPRGQIGQLAAINFYSFCAEEGITFEPELSGADQTGLVDVGIDDLGSVVIEAEEAPPETTSSTTSPTTTTLPTPEMTRGPLETTGDTDAAGSGAGFPSWIALIGGGVALALLGGWLYRRRAEPWRALLDRWTAARDECDEARKAIADAAAEGERAQTRLKAIEAERDRLCKAWPPACWPTEEGDWIEDREGNRITARDVHMRKVALGEVWADYKAGRITAGEVEARWREMDTPEFRQQMRETDEAYRRSLEKIDAEIANAVEMAEAAGAREADARAKAEESCGEAEALKKAYETCVDEAPSPHS